MESNEQVIYRMSSLGSCLKSLVATRLGYDPLPVPEKMQTLYDEGSRLEDIVIQRLDGEYRWNIYDQQLEVNLPVTEKILLQGHIDGKASARFVEERFPARCVEIKSSRNFDEIVQKGWETPGIIQKYKWQVSGYILGTGLELVLVVIDGTPELDDHERRMHFLYQEEPFYSIEQIKARVLQAEYWARRGELPSECDYKYYPCPFVYLHEDEKVELIDDAQIDVLARQYKQAQRDEKAAKEKTGKTRAALEKGTVGGKWTKTDKGSLKMVTTGGSSLTKYESNNPAKWDENQMVLDGIEPEKYKTQGKSWKMRVDVKEEENEK